MIYRVKVDIRALQRQARGSLPAAVYDFFAGGSGRETTLRANVKAWRRVPLLPHALRDVSRVSTAVEVNGARLATPVGVAPTAFHSLAHPEGELATAAGAAAAGALFVLATRSSRRIEDCAAVTEAAGGTWWFQVYVMRDRELTAALVRRAAAAGAAAIVLTADTPVVGRKRGNGGEGIIAERDFVVNTGPLLDLSVAAQAPDVTPADIGWIGELSGGLPVIVKGVLRADDALACARHGAAGVIVSNHGGRQLDGAVATACALPAVVAALRVSAGEAAGTCEVYVDGGLRSGEDILAALALGARAAFLGRPVLWALASGGSQQVTALLTGLTDALAHAMALAGATGIGELDGLVPGGTSPLWKISYRAACPAVDALCNRDTVE
jgi:4-hydroxymandelate oxidase